MSSLGDFFLEVTGDGDGEEVELQLHAKAQAASVRMSLLYRAYEHPPEIEDRRGDAVYVQVGFMDNRRTRHQIAVFRVGDELRAASRPAQVAPGDWAVFQVIKLAPRAEIDPIHSDPH